VPRHLHDGGLQLHDAGILGFDGEATGGAMHRSPSILRALRHVLRDLVSTMQALRRHAEALFGDLGCLVVVASRKRNDICKARRLYNVCCRGWTDRAQRGIVPLNDRTL
jgi:hypothetical protein